MTNKDDIRFMNYALNLAKKNLGQTAPNPAVGCVIVKNDEIIATGVTAKNGRPHAETQALAQVKNKKDCEGAEIYVTLEPCCHQGLTPPCVDEIIKAKPKRVIIATSDIDQRVDGGGIKKLSGAGIEVICGVLETEAKEVNRGFFKAKSSGLPFVTLKLATSLDGKVATKNFDSKWITNEKSRRFAHFLRAKNEAILVGATTVKKDDPSLDCRLAGLEEFSPKRVVVAGDLNFDFGLKIFQNSAKNAAIFLTKIGQKIPKNFPAEVIFCAEKNGLIDLQDAMKKLCESGVNSVLVEGGQKIASDFLKENLVDELIWIRAAKIIGNDGIAAISTQNFSTINEIPDRFTKLENREFDGDIAEIFRRK